MMVGAVLGDHPDNISDVSTLQDLNGDTASTLSGQEARHLLEPQDNHRNPAQTVRKTQYHHGDCGLKIIWPMY